MPNDNDTTPTPPTHPPSNGSAAAKYPHKLRGRVRPKLPAATVGPTLYVFNARAGVIVVPLADRPEQRTAIEREGGVWDPDDECWRFANAKQRDALQREFDDGRKLASNAIRSTSVKLLPGLNPIGRPLWAEIGKLRQVERMAKYLETFEDLRKVPPRQLADMITRTGDASVLRSILALEVPELVTRAATKALQALGAK